MLHFLEDRYVEFLRNHRSITVLRLDIDGMSVGQHADARCEKLECLPASLGKNTTCLPCS